MVASSRYAVALAVFGLAAFISSVDAKKFLLEIVVAAQAMKAGHPMWTAAVAVLLVVVWILSFMPLTPLEVSIGFLFGVRVGYVVVYLGKVIGCTAAFVLGRTILRNWAQNQFGKHDMLRAVNLAVLRQPYKICFVVRLAYIPIALKNFGLAVLSVKPAVFIASVASVEILNSSLLVTVGSTAKDLGSLLSGKEPQTPAQIAMMFTGTLCLLAFFGLLSLFTRRALADLRAEEAALQNSK